MIKRLTAAALISVAALAACSDEDLADETVETTTDQSADAGGDDSEGSTGDDPEGAGTDQSADVEGDDSEGVMTVDDGVATSTDGRFSFPVAEGWQAYPAPLDERVNITVLLISDVNNTEFAANIIGTWADPVPGVPTDYEEWREASGHVFTGEGVVVEDAEPVEIDGQTLQGLEVTRDADGMSIKQLVYPIFSDEGFQEIAFSASPDVFDENIDDVLAMISELEMNF